jgi:hypothetical protein
MRINSFSRFPLIVLGLINGLLITDLSFVGDEGTSFGEVSGAVLGSKGYNRNSLACLRNAGFHFTVTHKGRKREAQRNKMHKGCTREAFLLAAN